MKKHFLFFILMPFLFLTSCSEDDEVVEPIDIREQAIGVYNAEMSWFNTDGNTQFANATAQTRVSKDSNDPNSILIEIVGNGDVDTFIIRGNKIAEASNGFTFDIVPYNQTDSEGDNMNFTGMNGITLNGSQYHGAFFSADNKIEFYIDGEYEDRQFSDYDFWLSVKAIKTN